MRISDWSSDVCSSDLEFCTPFSSRLVPVAAVLLLRIIGLSGRRGRGGWRSWRTFEVRHQYSSKIYSTRGGGHHTPHHDGIGPVGPDTCDEEIGRAHV